MSNEKETQSGAGGLQRETEKARGPSKLEVLRSKRVAIKEGHTTGGYCDTEKLIEVEKEIYGILSKDLEAAKKKHGYSPDPKFKHPEIRALELEVHGLAYKPKLVVAAE